jgi:hypothetical protein
MFSSKYTDMFVFLTKNFWHKTVINGKHRKATYEQTQENYEWLGLRWHKYTYITHTLRIRQLEAPDCHLLWIISTFKFNTAIPMSYSATQTC